ncbi:hypothetical protein AMTR_s00063p00185550 [Amborella trichopoda]|uniref:Uncharacterized protein n=1 Tax=Amborella trichopoda TaxID=13333 RepID=U5D219_AMBTC|nr:hypothetical protein AMTR_s00063p00185550 [Amborella trichopoda]
MAVPQPALRSRRYAHGDAPCSLATLCSRCHVHTVKLSSVVACTIVAYSLSPHATIIARYYCRVLLSPRAYLCHALTSVVCLLPSCAYFYRALTSAAR